MEHRHIIFRLLVIVILTLTFAVPTLHAQEAEDKSELAKTLIVKVNNGLKFGAGIIFNIKGGYLFIATARHVVEGSEDGFVDVEFKFARNITVKAKLIKNSQRLDLAVLQVDIQNSRIQGLLLTNIPFELLQALPSLHKGMPVFPIGHPAGKDWYVSRNPGIIQEVIFDADILFEFECYPGHSGGGLFTANWNLAGMILQDDVYDCNALSFRRIYATLKDYWDLDVSQERLTPAESNTPTPTPIPTPSASELNQKKIQQLLKKADAYFARQWYTTPEATSALPIYLEVLSLDPLNAHALEKIDWMANYYKTRAEKELKRNRKPLAIQAYQTYLNIMPNDEEILDRLIELTTTLTPSPTKMPTQRPTVKPESTTIATPKPRATATPEPSTAPIAGQEYHDPISGIDFVWIPEGCFQMGCVSGINCENDEKPVHEVCLDGFWMGKTEVTQAQWENIMDNNPSSSQGDTRPVESVSWSGIQEFLEKLNAQAGQRLYRLPSEAEWEYAARAGTETMYNFGNDVARLGEYAWYRNNSNSQTHPVGKLKPNAWGLYDMHGNVSEWCQDWYDKNYYSKSPKNIPKGPPSSFFSRVLRGGSWLISSPFCRSADRSYCRPSFSTNRNGFRVVVGGNAVAWFSPKPKSSAAPIAGQEYHAPISGIDFVWIPEGCFQMGCVSGISCQDDEKPVHEVCLDGFWMGKTEVTQAQWENIMGNHPSSSQGDTRPVESVSWSDIQEFLEKLNAQAGQRLYRLPSEAEWEYAARAGTETMYNFGNDVAHLGEYAWYRNNSNSQTHPVGQLKPNAWGLYDMHGNVSEWCQDWYDKNYYFKSPKNNPEGPSFGGYPTLRGGAWPDISRDCRSAYRGRHNPDFGSSYVGFRVVVGVAAWGLH